MFDDEQTLRIYTDGSSYKKPTRLGGYAVRFVYFDASENEVTEDFLYPGFHGATSNEMELYACVKGLDEALKFREMHRMNSVVILTDSMYVKNNYKKAIYEWPKTKWMLRSGGPVLNVELWKKLVKRIKKIYSSRKSFDIRWVKGHAKDDHNKAVDRNAKRSAKHRTRQRISVVNVRRKRSKQEVAIGSVKLRGQKLSIRVTTDQYLKAQKLYRLKYEVISKKSEYFECVDVICSKTPLSAGHRYLVTLGNDSKNPMIVDIHREYG